MCFKIDWASLIVGSKFTVFALAIFQVQAPGRRFNGGFFALPVCVGGGGGLIFGGIYTWRGLFSEFYGIMIIAELSGRSRQSPIVLGGEGQSLGTKEALSIRPVDTH